MYLDFYHLKKAPFHITPDPEFLFLSPSHKAALGALVYGIEERLGFVALIGEVGLGKTTILHAYLERVDQEQLKTISIFNANLSFSDLLKTLCREFGLEVTMEDVFDTINRLHQVLIEEYKGGRNVVLIVDEAQHMPIETLEHLRMFSNLETSTQRLIQIVLVGQPEFEDKLNAHALRQLKQRLVIRTTLSPLSDEESLAYIEHRLAKVAMTHDALFTKGALRRIIKQGKGVPRVLNILCTNALIQGFGYEKRRISARIAQAVIADYAGKKLRRQFRPRVAVAGATVLLGVLFWLSPYQQVMLSKIDNDGVVKHTLESLAQFAALMSTTPATSQKTSPSASVQSTQPVPESAPSLPSATPEVDAPGNPTETSEPTSPAAPVVRTIKKGDQLTKLAVEVYGASNQTVLAWIKKHNPQLRDMNRIGVGEQITFPPLPARSE